MNQSINIAWLSKEQYKSIRSRQRIQTQMKKAPGIMTCIDLCLVILSKLVSSMHAALNETHIYWIIFISLIILHIYTLHVRVLPWGEQIEMMIFSSSPIIYRFITLCIAAATLSHSKFPFPPPPPVILLSLRHCCHSLDWGSHLYLMSKICHWKHATCEGNIKDTCS